MNVDAEADAGIISLELEAINSAANVGAGVWSSTRAEMSLKELDKGGGAGRLGGSWGDDEGEESASTFSRMGAEGRRAGAVKGGFALDEGVKVGTGAGRLGWYRSSWLLPCTWAYG